MSLLVTADVRELEKTNFLVLSRHDSPQGQSVRAGNKDVNFVTDETNIQKDQSPFSISNSYSHLISSKHVLFFFPFTIHPLKKKINKQVTFKQKNIEIKAWNKEANYMMDETNIRKKKNHSPFSKPNLNYHQIP